MPAFLYHNTLAVFFNILLLRIHLSIEVNILLQSSEEYALDDDNLTIFV